MGIYSFEMSATIRKRTVRRPPAASDAEIRAYLLSRLKTGQRPTYAAMRAELGGGRYSRLVRVRKQLESELATSDVAEAPVVPAGVDDLVGRMEEVLDRQLQAFETANREWARRLETASAKPSVPRAGKGQADAAVPLERLEVLERKLQAALDQLQALSRKLDPQDHSTTCRRRGRAKPLPRYRSWALHWWAA